jgi:hypothetical protein
MSNGTIETKDTTPYSPDWGQEAAMNTSPVKSEEHTLDVTTGGSIAQSLGGLAAIVLAIVGLVHIVPHYMVAIACLTIGAGLIFQGGNISMEYTALLSRMSQGKLENATVGGGISIEILAGVAGLVLGVLALVAVSPTVLLPVAVIVFGAALIVSSGDISRLNSLKLENSGASDLLQRLARESLAVGSGTQIFIGLGSVVLGILALIGYDWMVLSLVALLAIGIAVLVSGTGVTDRMFEFFRA